MYLKINALGDYKKKYDPFARLLALKRGVGVCSVVGVVSGFYGTYEAIVMYTSLYTPMFVVTHKYTTYVSASLFLRHCI